MIAGAVIIRHTVHIQIYYNVIQTILKTIGKSGVKVFGCAKSELGEAIIFADENHTLRIWLPSGNCGSCCRGK
jgi:hypothetical protein